MPIHKCWEVITNYTDLYKEQLTLVTEWSKFVIFLTKLTSKSFILSFTDTVPIASHFIKALKKKYR